MIRRPQKPPSESITNKQLMNLVFPLYGSAKLDGYRCVTNLCAHTSSMKLVKNKFIQSILSQPKYAGLDGELIVGKPSGDGVFNRTTSAVSRADGEPDFTFYVFDIHNMSGEPYKTRLEELGNYRGLPRIHIVKQTKLYSLDDILAYELKCVQAGFEGAVIRSNFGVYKDGRCTLREGNIFKRKPTEDDECTIIGFEEQMLNKNKSTMSETGNMVRSSHKANKVGKGTLGKFLVESPRWDKPFAIGTGKGLTNELRQEIWDNREHFLGKVITYKYQLYGSIDAPRQPIYKGFRDPADMTDY